MDGWIDIGAADELSKSPVSRVVTPKARLAISFRDGVFGAISSACNHVGGPLGEGHLEDDHIVCPWHQWRFHRCTGVGEPPSGRGSVTAYPVKVENGRVLVDLAAATPRVRPQRPQHFLARPIERAPGPLRLAGISTTVMDSDNARFSGSDHLLGLALEAAQADLAETRLIRLNDLRFRACKATTRRQRAPALGLVRSPRCTPMTN